MNFYVPLPYQIASLVQYQCVQFHIFMIPVPNKCNIIYLDVLISDKHLSAMAVKILTQICQNPCGCPLPYIVLALVYLKSRLQSSSSIMDCIWAIF